MRTCLLPVIAMLTVASAQDCHTCRNVYNNYCCKGSIISSDGSHDISKLICCQGDPIDNSVNLRGASTCTAGTAVPLTQVSMIPTTGNVNIGVPTACGSADISTPSSLDVFGPSGLNVFGTSGLNVFGTSSFNVFATPSTAATGASSGGSGGSASSHTATGTAAGTAAATSSGTGTFTFKSPGTLESIFILGAGWLLSIL